MSAKLGKKETVDVLNRYCEQLEPVQSIASSYGMTRQGIWKLLRRNGVDPKQYGRLRVTCCACGQEFERSRSHIRKSKNVFCSLDCYYAYLEAKQDGVYFAGRQGQRISREVVAAYFPLESKHVVHHKDRNNYNNNINNLMVFANQGDHIRFHRLGPEYVSPLFDGEHIR